MVDYQQSIFSFYSGVCKGIKCNLGYSSVCVFRKARFPLNGMTVLLYTFTRIILNRIGNLRINYRDKIQVDKIIMRTDLY